MNSTSIEQTWRLLRAGFSGVTCRMGDGHEVKVNPVPLGDLWDAVNRLDTRYDLPTDFTSAQLVEALVQILERHHQGQEPINELKR